MTKQNYDTPATAELQLSLEDLVKAVNQQEGSKDWILALLAEGIIQPMATTGDNYVFNSVTLTQVRRASRLRRDFDASPQAIGLILSLLEELRPLRQLQRQMLVSRVVYEVEE